jgi:hypothetical protein
MKPNNTEVKFISIPLNNKELTLLHVSMRGDPEEDVRAYAYLKDFKVDVPNLKIVLQFAGLDFATARFKRKCGEN